MSQNPTLSVVVRGTLVLMSSGTVATAIDSPCSRGETPACSAGDARDQLNQSQWRIKIVTAQATITILKQACEVMWIAGSIRDVRLHHFDFPKGPFRNALRLALEEAVSEELIRQERGWKLMLLLPRMLLHRPPRGGLIAKDKLHERFPSFARGEWLALLEASGRCDEEAAIARRRRRHQGDDVQKTAARAELKVALGELSSARQALATLQQCRNDLHV